ncbi:adenylate cyclase type 2-like isoform X2 [Argiope bruennichi]|uniref:adenylate cyclase type 2-like isoform X2 n=1 Tax=Argiope bruennichi TaxID=94029 RepID=UPI0024957C60|nr:adenylate cyclase type 2-like isoform X2 [Argiope bruennichi]
MSGLELIARDSKSEIERNAEAATVYFSQHYNKDDDERNWSFSYLRKNERLTDMSWGAITTGRWCRSISFLVHFFIFVAAYKESLFRSPNAKIAAAGIVLFCMIMGEMATSIYRLGRGHQEPIMRQTYYIILTTTVLLPFPRKLYSAMCGAMVITIDIALSAMGSSKLRKLHVVLLADLVFFLTTLLVGLYIRYLIEVMSRRAFLDRRECVESKIKIETEKNQEEKFLQSILPTHIASEVRNDIRKAIRDDVDKLHMTQKPFNKLYVEKHKNVSILYADIVNSMLLAASLKVSDLVATLNDLFGRFDDAAEKNGCMRIKLLGDCYYCVSGVIDKSPRHADNSVVTGLAMIDIIRSVREKRNINVDMRIGIHTGNILGGLLGLRKWQFDIWSKDVTIASHMEQGGVPGQVHITQTTKDLLQDDWYDIQPGDGHLRDSYLQTHEIKTYLIKPSDQPKSRMGTPESDKVSNGARFQRQSSTQSNCRVNITKLQKRQSSTDFLPMSRRGAIGYSLHQYRKMVSQVNKIMENTIDKMALSKRDQWFSRIGIQPLLLTFRESGTEKPYLNQPDPLFKHYLTSMLIIYLGITIIHVLIWSSTLEFWTTYGFVLLLIIAACVFAWVGYIWLYIKKDDNDILLNSSVLKISRTVWKTTGLRVTIWLAISSMILFCSIVGLNECLDSSFFQPFQHHNNTLGNVTHIADDTKIPNCEYPWFYTLSAVLAMTTTSVFLRIHFLLKLVVNSVSLAAYWYIIDVRSEEVFRQQAAKLADWEEFDLPTDRSHCYYLTFVLLILHILDRQVEYICRLDYLMKVKLKAEQEEARTMEMINRILLHNILPPHVSRFYLNKQLEEDSQRIEAYHEERCAVAVLFASIPSFADFYYEDGQNEEGLRCIQLLNEIICDFDLILGEREFQGVEKIKTIGSTYMAACGLQAQDRGSLQAEENPIENVVTLVKFAVSMMERLSELNKDAMQDFQLRVGISVGPVMAGVVGTVKPQYDIWGDTVNVASRMESTGISGRIQVTKEVADLLCASDSPYKCECRGEIFVKGKGELTTYLLKTPYDEPHIQITVF